MSARHFVVCGAGIIGASTTYSLVHHPQLGPNDTVTLIEGTEIAAGASGKSGGFLALDWHGPQTASLAQLSFRLHQEYADAHDGAKLWGYRRLDTLSVSANTRSKGKGKVPEGLEWLRSDIVKGTKILGTKRTTAQVHPRLLTMRLVELAQAKGAKVILGQVNAIEQALGSGPTAVVVLGRDGHSQTIPATDVIITAGPWSGDLAYKLLGKQLKKRVAIEGNRAHSIIVKTEKALSEHALFCDLAYEGGHGEPEIYCRPDGTAYICGAGDDEPLPANAGDVDVDPGHIALIKAQAAAMSPDHLGIGIVEAEQACYLPQSRRLGGAPYVGKLTDGVWIGAGHSCWGITLGPGTGQCLAELLLEGKVRSADISALVS